MGDTRGGTDGQGFGSSTSRSTSEGTHQTLAPVHEDYLELASRTYQTFDEDVRVWARDIRNLTRGRAFVRLVDDTNLYDVDVKRSAPGFLAFDTKTLRDEMPEVLDDLDRLIERNFQSNLFASPTQIESEMEVRIHRLLHKPIVISSTAQSPTPAVNPFIDG